ncbi:hypothetical protein HMPREF0322_01339 [Desulfitobacterium hafniense DP7]|uniref:Uncharacterized protein n=1 Tax=Desulfitobacterium hafniense DP7 TaxID=537010 RepID=G9XK56_DESHA|nr:hypothetical protein HMPREF0322_01339 [Desulfitobacterium hafniense DP7]
MILPKSSIADIIRIGYRRKTTAHGTPLKPFRLFVYLNKYL